MINTEYVTNFKQFVLLWAPLCGQLVTFVAVLAR